MNLSFYAASPAQPPIPAPPPPPERRGFWEGAFGVASEIDPVGAATENIVAAARTAFAAAMQTVWDAGIWLLHAGFTLADELSHVRPGDITGRGSDNPVDSSGEVSSAASVDVSVLWSTMVWLATAIALVLLFVQITAAAVRGGRGVGRVVTGPVQFGIALAVTTGAVAVVLTGADGVTTMLMSLLGEQGSFTAALDNPAVADRFGNDPDLGADVEDGVRAMILGIVALFGVIPAAAGYALMMLFRAAAIMVLVTSIPIAAACLVADATSSIFWRTVHWLVAAVLLKPAMALVLVIGVWLTSTVEGVAGLLVGAAVLLVSVFCPMVLYRMLSFVDPGTGAGQAVRSVGRSNAGGGVPAADDGRSEAMNRARFAEHARTTGSTGATGSAGTSGAGAGAVGGAAASAVVGGYLATKSAGQAVGGYASSQMVQTGIGHHGQVPVPGPARAQVRAAAAASSSAQEPTVYTAIGPYSYEAGPDSTAGGSSDHEEPPGPGPEVPARPVEHPDRTGPPDEPDRSGARPADTNHDLGKEDR